ncbi:heterokaryon incompatibility protein-domain-containing protein, partial [Usnea florida]
MKVIQAWLNSTADSRHSRREDSSRRLPGRLIDVSPTYRAVKLMEREDCIRKDEPKDLSYLALSHCWGASKFLTLTNSNYPSFCQGLDLALLSKTFQHAISVCRRLGFRFIWIDSLCIIQDSAEDWLKQSVTMQDVYRYAELTIAASSAWDSSEGLFVDQHPLPLSPWLYAMPRLNQARYSWERDVKYSRLNNRAWVLQEQIMSPNVVYFGETQLYWRTGTARVDKVDTISDSQLAILSEDVMYKPRTQNNQEAESYMSRPHVKPWWDMIEIYTQRSLTRHGDKLVAIAGVAALVVREFGDDPSPQYLVGLWNETLVAGLLWYVNGKRKSFRPPIYLAPSWSWVSVEG